MQQSLSPVVLVIVIVVALAVLAGIWFMTYGKKPERRGEGQPIPKVPRGPNGLAMPPSGDVGAPGGSPAGAGR